MSYKIILILGIALAFMCHGQGEKAAKNEFELIEKGNGYYQKKQYSMAQKEYAKASKENGNSYVPTYNMGNSLYRQDSLAQAVQQFTNATATGKTRAEQATAFHNLGNAHLKQKKYEESIKAYKESLRRNPTDDETRYNLAYAQKMLKNNKGQNNRDKDQKQNKNQDKKDDKQSGKDQNDRKKQNDQQKGDQENSKQNPQQSQPSKGHMSKEQAESMLNAIDQEEAQLRKNLRIKEEKSKPQHIDKDW